MTESEAITGITDDAAEAVSLKNSITPAFGEYDDAKAVLLAAVASVGARINEMESNVNYAIEKFL